MVRARGGRARILRADVLNGAPPPGAGLGPVIRGGRAGGVGRGGRVGRGAGRGVPAPDPRLAGLGQLGRALRVDLEGLGQDGGGQRRGRLLRGLRPTRGVGAAVGGGDGAAAGGGGDGNNLIAESLGNLTKLVTDLQDKFEKQTVENEESFNRKIEEENSKITHKVTTQINNNLEKFDQTKSEEKFKFKVSGAAISRIVEVRVKLRVALAEGDRDFEDFADTKTGKSIKEALDILDRQEGLFRLAETNKHRYKLVDKITEDSTTYSYLSDPELVKKIKAAEKDLDKGYETGGKKTYGGRWTGSGGARFRSRSRSRSPARREKKGASPPRGRGFGFECHWCHQQGHS